MDLLLGILHAPLSSARHHLRVRSIDTQHILSSSPLRIGKIHGTVPQQRRRLHWKMLLRILSPRSPNFYFSSKSLLSHQYCASSYRGTLGKPTKATLDFQECSIVMLYFYSHRLPESQVCFMWKARFGEYLHSIKNDMSILLSMCFLRRIRYFVRQLLMIAVQPLL